MRAPPATTTHPLAQVRQAAVDVAARAGAILSRTDLPRVYFQSSVFARGSGANPNGQLDGSLPGLGLDRANWAAGVQVVFPERVRLHQPPRAQGGARRLQRGRRRRCSTRRC